MKELQAQQKPTLICTGYISEVGELKHKDESPYYNLQVTVKSAGVGPNGKKAPDQKTMLTFRPEFFNPDFDPNNRADMKAAYGDKSKGVEFVFGKNIAAKEKSALLQAICGDQETFAKLGEELKGLSDYSPETIESFLRGFIADMGPVSFGYILKQPSKKTDEVDEEGKAVYERSQFYDVDTYFWLTEANIKKVAKRVEKASEKRAKGEVAEKVYLCFDPAELGVEVA